MTQQIIKIAAVPNQSVTAMLDGAPAQITLTTTDRGLFADIIYDGVPVALGRLCLDRTDINPNRYLGLPQLLAFADLRGFFDPVYSGFGTRFVLVYGNP